MFLRPTSVSDRRLWTRLWSKPGDIRLVHQFEGRESPSIEYYPFSLDKNDAFVHVDVLADPDDDRYENSKLYWSARPEDAFDESRTVFFRLRYSKSYQRAVLPIPEAARQSRYLHVRLDALPHSAGRIESGPAAVASTDTDVPLRARDGRAGRRKLAVPVCAPPTPGEIQFVTRLHESRSIEFYPFDLHEDDAFVELALRVKPASCHYEYSKLYWAAQPDDAFEESRVMSFRLRYSASFQQARLPIPDAAQRSRYLKLRVDALPYAAGTIESRPARVLAAARATVADMAPSTFDGIFSPSTNVALLDPQPEPGDIHLVYKLYRSCSIEYYPLLVKEQDECFDLELSVEPAGTAFNYNYSKVYWAASPDEDFEEDRVICFRIHHARTFQKVRLVIPDAARQRGFLRLRLDALPYSEGRIDSRPVRIARLDDDPELTRRARLIAQKERVRAEVVTSERTGRAVVPHYPESLSLELTAGCNLTCSHCSSHGDDAEHHMNNVRAAFDLAMLERLAHELFPHLTLVNLVGRGEPMMVGARLWDRLMTLLDRYNNLFVCVTNGHFIKKRISKEIMHLVDTITVSIDGTTQDVFAANRGGAKLDVVLDNVDYYHALRQSLPLARRPKLGFSWTLKKNNVHQFPDFIRLVKPYDPSLLYVRHLFVFRDKDRHESLIDEPELVNRYLNEAYALIEGTGIKLDVPPLMPARAVQ